MRSDDVFYFSLAEDYTKCPNWSEDEGHPASNALKHRIVCYARDDPPDERWTDTELDGFSHIMAGVSDVPKQQFVGTDMQGNVYVLGGGDDEIEQPLKKWKETGVKRGAITRLRTIEGVLYVAGTGRSVGYREGKNNWISLTQGMSYSSDTEWNTAGFLDIDGFSRSEIYGVGRQGDVWKFDGKIWSQVHFPSNIDLYSVCCAGDGFVYISGYGGTTFKGRNNKWTKIHDDTMTLPFNRMVWYEGKVWCTSDYGLWTIENDKLEVADVSDEVKVASGYMSVKGGTLLLGGYSGASYCQAGKWTVIF
ncbi:hypothetical protein F2P44_30370 [Massilia sp. CCM 8695]|uniref:Photosynthesis system II assembly factor Ycf48/Hcf136-like domain-containing protein n=1 Tax=Massilia frigida TaxID=2609281 RepID=A0ABX0NJR7_9BURK|nr:hypothetical protein [Massilia frigida]NHZ83540.1 hypothetical protein [Massilia frigida]